MVLPAFNEGLHLRAVVGRLPAWVDGVIVVDDASTDDTLAVAQAIDDSRLVVLHHDANEGVGGAMVTGLRAALEAGFDIVVKMDADEQMDVLELPDLLRPIELGLADYAKGNRFRRTGRPRLMPASRWFGNVMLSFMTKVASGYWHVFDPQCGFVAITRPTLSRLKLDGMARDYFFENDMLIRLNVIDARVVDVETSALYGNEVSQVRVGRVSWSFPFRLARGFFWRFIKRHIVNDFGAIAVLVLVGGLLGLFGGCFGIYRWVESAATGQPATAGTVMLAVTPLIVGIQMLLQALVLEVQGSPGAQETRDLTRAIRALELAPGRPPWVEIERPYPPVTRESATAGAGPPDSHGPSS